MKGDLYIDPADNMIMVYLGGHPRHKGRHMFYCPTATSGESKLNVPYGNNIFYYDQHDLRYLEKVNEENTV